MPLTKQEWKELEKKAHEMRLLTLQTTYDAGSAHIGGALSAMDIMVALYYKYMNIDPNDPDKRDRDRFILSKGHSGVGLASILADKGYIKREALKTFNLTGSKLGIHLDSNKVPGVDASTGSLGHGLSISLGLGMGARLTGDNFMTYCLMGDGECDEGAVWEAAMAIPHFKATNVVTMVDRNKCMIDGRTENVMTLEPFADKWTAFGYETLVVDGHSFPAICTAFDKCIERSKQKDGQPIAIVFDTLKGCGIKFMSDNYKWHYGSIDDAKFAEAKADLEEYYAERLKATDKE
jgi:transketolase